MNGHVDRAGRALVTLRVRPNDRAQVADLIAWVDTAFTGELVVPFREIQRLGLKQSSTIMAGLADGSQKLLDTYSCLVEWLEEERGIEVIESDGLLPLLGVGLLKSCRLKIDYRLATLIIK